MQMPLGFAVFCLLALVCASATCTAQTHPDYRAVFDRSDQANHEGKGYSESHNRNGELAWNESYVLMGYMEMYAATHDRDYLRRLIAHFDRMLTTRDDVLGVADAYAGKPLAGWGSDLYSGGKWHVWIVHTGMITIGPAEFVRTVKAEKGLQKEFGAKAAEYRARLEESIRDAEPYWHDGPGPDEGYYYGAYLASVLPLNQQNSLGVVLLDMVQATGNKNYRDKVERLAHFFRHRLRNTHADYNDWAYWPRENEEGPNSEDISHASINMDFVGRCAAAHLVFTRQDVARFARTWLHKIHRPDGTWADTVAGTGKGNEFRPGAIALWLGLCPALPADLGSALYQDAAHAYNGAGPYDAEGMLAVARLLRYESLYSQHASSE